MVNEYKNQKVQINKDLLIGIIILLYKRNERKLAKNYRPICLLSTIFKIIQYLILNRIDEKIHL